MNIFYGLNRVYMYIVLDTETNLPHQNSISKIHLPMLVMELIIFCEKSNIFYAEMQFRGKIYPS
jgi:hypothetical protein